MYFSHTKCEYLRIINFVRYFFLIWFTLFSHYYNNDGNYCIIVMGNSTTKLQDMIMRIIVLYVLYCQKEKKKVKSCYIVPAFAHISKQNNTAQKSMQWKSMVTKTKSLLCFTVLNRTGDGKWWQNFNSLCELSHGPSLAASGVFG